MIGYRITGRLPGVSINAEGSEQARGLIHLRPAVIFSSPLERAVETATPLADRLGLPIHINEAFNEVHFGDWSGLTLQELESVPGWKLFNQFRSSYRLPGGELMLEVQRRVVDEMARIAREHPDRTVAVFSHADVIKSAVSHYIGAPLDLMDRIEIHPASVTRITLYEWGVKIFSVNERLWDNRS